MNDNTLIGRLILSNPSFKWIIRILTPIYFLSSILAFQYIGPIIQISCIISMMGIGLIWVYVDLASNFKVEFSIKLKPQNEYFSSHQFSSLRNNQYKHILQTYPVGHYVYIIKDVSASGYCKIGRTIHPASRLRKFGIALPFQIHILAIIPCEDEVLLESVLHNHFINKRINGEWFNLTGGDILHIVTHYGMSL